MGGHAGGEIAAQIAVRLFIERFQQEATPILKNPLTFLHETMVKAHAALGSYSAQFSMLETPRTTCVACIVQPGTRTGFTSAIRASTSIGVAR
jgi:serine/threonine protein phosphatase PrpC